jgi:hypothetical protein
VELNPIGGRIASNEGKFVVGQIKQNSVTDHVAIVAARGKLLGLVNGKILERVGPEMRQQFERIATAHIEIHHVVRLVEQDAGLGPCALFISPIGELGRDHGIYVGADLRVAHHFDCVAGSLKGLLQVPVGHSDHSLHLIN